MGDADPAGAPPASGVGLSYIDVLFGLAAGRAFASAFDDVARLSSVEWSHFLVALVVITCSWIGYHLNRTRSHPRDAEFSAAGAAPLVQIGIDIALVALYYRLSARVRLDHTTSTELRILILVFGLYTVWDLLDLLVTRHRKNTMVRAGVDVVWLVLFVVLASAHLAAPWTAGKVVAVDCVLIGLLVIYRYVAAPVARALGA